MLRKRLEGGGELGLFKTLGRVVAVAVVVGLRDLPD